MKKSCFELLKDNICKNIMKAKTLTEIKKRMNYIIEEYDLEEEDIN